MLPSRPPTDDGRPSRLTTPPLSDCRRADGREAVEIRNLIPRPPGAGAAGSDSEKGRDPTVTAERDGRLSLVWATKRPRSRQRPNRPRSFGPSGRPLDQGDRPRGVRQRPATAVASSGSRQSGHPVQGYGAPWSQVDAAGGKRPQIQTATQYPLSLQTAATACHELRSRAQGQEGVDGSSRSEGLQNPRSSALYSAAYGGYRADGAFASATGSAAGAENDPR